jgi:2-isopropylmalate synthase
LAEFYPSLGEMSLIDYKVRVINSSLTGSASLVRVLITSSDGTAKWTTVGVSANIVEASWRGLVDSVEYKLMKDGTKPVPLLKFDDGRPRSAAPTVRST